MQYNKSIERMCYIMARSVSDVNESISAANATIGVQSAQISACTTVIQQNTNEYEALRTQKETLENTQLEIQTLCGSLTANIGDIGTTYGSNNGFAKGFSENAGAKVTEIQGNVLGKLQSMVTRIDNQMNICQTNIMNAQNDLAAAQTALANAQNNLSTFKTELIEAEAEEEAAAIAAAAGV